MNIIKSVQLRILKIKYSGDFIGDDIRAEVEILGKFLRIDKRIKADEVAEINKEVGRFEIDSKLFYAEVSITVIEKDLLFNDVGSVIGGVKVDTANIKPQQFVFKAQIKESRSVLGKIWGNKVAVFEITLEAIATDAVRYVSDEGDGWLKVVLEDKHAEVSLPAYLKIKIERADAKREYIKILEGPYYGKTASVAFKNDIFSQFITGVKHESAAQAVYSISQKIFILNGKKYKTVDYPKAPWKKGLYDIEIPDYPHKGGRNYLDQSERAMTWFKIGHDGERYLHTGGQSLGCITVVEIKRWIEIYNILIKARKDSISVGALEVTD